MAAAAVLFAACASSTSSPAAPKSANDASASASSGCGRPVSSGTTTTSITVGGRTRLFIVHIPSGYSDTHPTPLVLNLHGSGSTAEQQEGFSGMDATADADTFIVVYPQAIIPSGTGFDWNIPGVPLLGGSPVPAGAANDETFLEDVVSTMRSRACIDPTRVYATGFSGGARMSSQLGCDAATTFAAVAPVSGLRLPAKCDAARPVPVISFHGLLDPVDPYAGHGQAYWTYSVPVAAQRWAAHDGCSPTADTSHPDPGVTLTEYGRCRGDSAVELYTFADEGHEWPGGPKLPRSITRGLGPQTDAIHAATVIWSFFAAHSMP